MEQLALPVTMPERHPTFNGWFGYEGRCADIALARDNADMIEQCYQLEYIDHSTKMFTGCTILAHAKRVAPKCAERLAALGFPEIA